MEANLLPIANLACAKTFAEYAQGTNYLTVGTRPKEELLPGQTTA